MMKKTDNYAIQAKQARERFLTYDQEKLIAKLGLKADEDWMYMTMLARSYRLSRRTGDLERKSETSWEDANTFGEVMVLLDWLCDSREGRFISGKWKNMSSFGLLFHTNLLENAWDPWADAFEKDPEGFRRACRALNGTPISTGDIAYAIELYDGLCIVVQLWFGDEEFPANLRFLWDENANMYLRYETMHFARGMVLERIKELMQ